MPNYITHACRSTTDTRLWHTPGSAAPMVEYGKEDLNPRERVIGPPSYARLDNSRMRLVRFARTSEPWQGPMLLTTPEARRPTARIARTFLGSQARGMGYYLTSATLCYQHGHERSCTPVQAVRSRPCIYQRVSRVLPRGLAPLFARRERAVIAATPREPIGEAGFEPALKRSKRPVI